MESSERDKLIELEATKPQCCSNHCNYVFEYRDIDQSWICLNCKEIIPIKHCVLCGDYIPRTEVTCLDCTIRAMETKEPKTQAHTEGKWKVVRYENYHGFSISANSEYGCITERWFDNKQSEERAVETSANADFIVKAVNNHQELVEALRLNNKDIDIIIEYLEAGHIIEGAVGFLKAIKGTNKQALKNTEEG